jgi:hypothetical protein
MNTVRRLLSVTSLCGVLLSVSSCSYRPVEPEPSPLPPEFELMTPLVSHSGEEIQIKGRRFDSTVRLIVAGRWIRPDSLSPTNLFFQGPVVEGSYEVLLVRGKDTTHCGSFFVTASPSTRLELADGIYGPGWVRLQNVIPWRTMDSTYTIPLAGHIFVRGDSLLSIYDGEGSVAVTASIDRINSRFRSIELSGRVGWRSNSGPVSYNTVHFTASNLMVQRSGNILLASGAGCYSVDSVWATRSYQESVGGEQISRNDSISFSPPYHRRMRLMFQLGQ